MPGYETVCRWRRSIGVDGGRKWLETALNGTRKRCACSADLNRWSIRSRSRVGRSEFSARLFNPLCRRCSLFGNALRIAGKLVGDHDPRLGARLAIKHTTQEALGGYLIAPLLDQDVQDDSVLVIGLPQPVTFATDLQRNFVQMPLVAGSHSSSTQAWLRTWCTTGGWSRG